MATGGPNVTGEFIRGYTYTLYGNFPMAVIGRALQVMMHRAEEKGLILRTSYCDPALAGVLIGDPYRLTQVLLNLLSNGIKFTSKGSVELSCRVMADDAFSQQLAIEVTDTGMGMDDGFVQHLFDKFTQEYDSVTRKYGGTGLGMSICKELIELMRGEIRVASKKGAGTAVTLLVQLEKGSESDLSTRDERPVDTEILKGKKVLGKGVGSPVAADPRSHYDFHRLDEIGAGDKAFLKKMVQLFVDTVPVEIAALQIWSWNVLQWRRGRRIG